MLSSSAKWKMKLRVKDRKNCTVINQNFFRNPKTCTFDSRCVVITHFVAHAQLSKSCNITNVKRLLCYNPHTIDLLIIEQDISIKKAPS